MYTKGKVTLNSFSVEKIVCNMYEAMLNSLKDEVSGLLFFSLQMLAAFSDCGFYL
jgi:hypothetical protein